MNIDHMKEEFMTINISFYRGDENKLVMTNGAFYVFALVACYADDIYKLIIDCLL